VLLAVPTAAHSPAIAARAESKRVNSLPLALCELVDNSISALRGSSHKVRRAAAPRALQGALQLCSRVTTLGLTRDRCEQEVTIDIIEDRGQLALCVADCGCGMDERGLAVFATMSLAPKNRSVLREAITCQALLPHRSGGQQTVPLCAPYFVNHNLSLVRAFAWLQARLLLFPQLCGMCSTASEPRTPASTWPPSLWCAQAWRAPPSPTKSSSRR
jgi:hypothetical protein